jgi:hypothetical protein
MSTDVTAHQAAPLTNATRPLYERMEELRQAADWANNLATRYQIAELTNQIWRGKMRVKECPTHDYLTSLPN